MAQLTKGYFHCIECDSLFEALLKDRTDQRCPHCGNPPTGKDQFKSENKSRMQEKPVSEFAPRPSQKLHGVNHDTQDIYEATLATIKGQKEGQDERVKRSKRKLKAGGKQWILIVSWAVLMVVIVAAIKYYNAGDEVNGGRASNEDEARQAALEKQKRQRTTEKALPACQRVMSEFLTASTAAAKAQYVYQGIKLSGVMNRHYRDAIGLSADESKVKILHANLLDGFPHQAIGALCMNGAGEKWEVVFLRVGDEWKIDWKALVRYDDELWLSFPTRADGAEGEFRLYLRVQNSNEDLKSKDMSLVFYKPKMFLRDEFRELASSPVSVLIDSPLGERILALPHTNDLKELPKVRVDTHGLHVGLIDPERYHRVQVRVKLHKESDNDAFFRLELLDILSNDWYGVAAKLDDK